MNRSQSLRNPETKQGFWFQLLFSFVTFLPLPMVWVLVYLAPFGSPGARHADAAAGIPLGAAAILISAITVWVLDAQRKRDFWIRIAAFLSMSLGTALAYGITVHPDFFSVPFMSIVQALCLILWKGNLYYGHSSFSPARSAFFRFGLAASIVLSVWIMLMGYALVTRSEPRWMESLIYNVYNAILAAVLYFMTIRTYGDNGRTIIAQASSFTVDGLDFGPVIGPVACQTAAMLIERNDSVSCQELRLTLKGEVCSCEFNDRPGFCADYSTMYNAVSKLRRLLEALRVGTVEDLPGSAGGQHRAWRFVPAEHVVAGIRTKEEQ